MSHRAGRIQMQAQNPWIHPCRDLKIRSCRHPWIRPCGAAHEAARDTDLQVKRAPLPPVILTASISHQRPIAFSLVREQFRSRRIVSARNSVRCKSEWVRVSEVCVRHEERAKRNCLKTD